MTRMWWAVVTIVVITLAAVGAGYLWIQANADQLQLHGHTYDTVIRQTEAERQKGLSGTKSLPAHQSMLFVFPSDSRWGIWMKDMNYPIDIVWLDNGQRVVYIVKDAQPSSYPTIFRPATYSRYVIELASGTIERTGISIGDKAMLPSEL